MSRTYSKSFHTYRRTTIAVSLLLALGFSGESFGVERHLGQIRPTAPSSTAHKGPSTRSVASCADDGTPGTLRYEIGQATPGDTVDLSSLPCTTITLSDQWVPSQLVVAQDGLTIKGPTDHSLALDGNATSRVFSHTGKGTLELDDLTIQNGLHTDDQEPSGGCIKSEGNLVLRASTVTGCEVRPHTASAYGGGLVVAGSAHIYDSQILGNKAAAAILAVGGGLLVYGPLTMQRTVVDSNQATRGSSTSAGGGVAALSTVAIVDSTISRNRSDWDAGIGMATYLGGLEGGYIRNSTISNNHADVSYAGIYTTNAITISNSTIAFNTAGYAFDPMYSIYVGIQTKDAKVMIESSIVSNNTDGDGIARDLGGHGNGSVSSQSSKNLIGTSNLQLPADTIRDCARLQPLADNGGGRLTVLPSANSPAIDAGSDGGLALDERGAPRIANAAADIGAVERQASDSDERVFADDFDGGCGP